MSCHVWLEGYGGFNSIYSVDKHFEDYSDDEIRLFWDNSYRYVVAVECAERETIFLDPQGFDTPKYVGLISDQ
jgi:hypothetical protein